MFSQVRSKINFGVSTIHKTFYVQLQNNEYKFYVTNTREHFINTSTTIIILLKVLSFDGIHL